MCRGWLPSRTVWVTCQLSEHGCLDWFCSHGSWIGVFINTSQDIKSKIDITWQHRTKPIFARVVFFQPSFFQENMYMCIFIYICGFTILVLLNDDPFIHNLAFWMIEKCLPHSFSPCRISHSEWLVEKKCKQYAFSLWHSVIWQHVFVE